MVITGSVHQKYLTVINMYVPQNTKIHTAKIDGNKGKMENSKTIVGNINITLTIKDRAASQKTTKKQKA